MVACIKNCKNSIDLVMARMAARIEPEVVERVAGELVQRTHSEPHWDARRGAVMGYERVTLYGLPLVVHRRIGYAQIDPQLARELFIRQALVEGDWETHHKFFDENRKLLERIGNDRESRERRAPKVAASSRPDPTFNQRMARPPVLVRGS